VGLHPSINVLSPAGHDVFHHVVPKVKSSQRSTDRQKGIKVVFICVSVTRCHVAVNSAPTWIVESRSLDVAPLDIVAVAMGETGSDGSVTKLAAGHAGGKGKAKVMGF
jgi:hypothetical protein